jgi:hypothetical protein
MAESDNQVLKFTQVQQFGHTSMDPTAFSSYFHNSMGNLRSHISITVSYPQRRPISASHLDGSLRELFGGSAGSVRKRIFRSLGDIPTLLYSAWVLDKHVTALDHFGLTEDGERDIRVYTDRPERPWGEMLKVKSEA